MSNTARINDLSGITSANDNDAFVIDTFTDTKKITFSNLCSAILNATITSISNTIMSNVPSAVIQVSSELTLNSGSWRDKTQTVSYTHDINKRNVIDVSVNSIKEWGKCQIYATEETSNDITFKCEEVPQSDLNFKVTSMG